MSLPLKDHRTSIDESTDMWLEVEAAVHRKDKATVSREILREWAKLKAHSHKVATKRLQAHGLQPELFGDDEHDSTADAGTTRNRK